MKAKIIKIIIACLSVLIMISGALFYLSDSGNSLEEEYGLALLFKVRRALPSPSDVVIVSIDRASADILKFPDDPETWSRAYYAQLIEKINQQKPAVVALNLLFSEPRDPTDDSKLANAIRANNNVILGSSIAEPEEGSEKKSKEIVSTPLISNAAFCSAPFLLPKQSTITELWTNHDGIPTFQVSVFHYFALKTSYPDVVKLLKQTDPELAAQLPASFEQLLSQNHALDEIQNIQAAFAKDEATLNSMVGRITEPKVKQLLKSWLALLVADESLYLNHYGDVGTVQTIPFYKVLASDNQNTDLFKDKIVLIGYSNDIEPEKFQNYNVYSEASNTVISPIEFAATAIANIINQAWLVPFSMNSSVLLILILGITVGGIFHRLNFNKAFLVALIIMCGYFAYAVAVFSSKNLWLPIAIPLIQMGIIMAWQTLNYHYNLRGVLASLKIPSFLVNRPKAISDNGSLKYVVCMATDIQDYSTLTNKLGAEQTQKLLNAYLEDVVYPIIERTNGTVTDRFGDGIFAFWASENNDPKFRQDVCSTVLEIQSAIAYFNAMSTHALPTRIGLHYGKDHVGFVGSKYGVTGSTPILASRIEGLNKFSSTQILASVEVIFGLTGIITREIGLFPLKGFEERVLVYEILGTSTKQ